MPIPFINFTKFLFFAPFLVYGFFQTRIAERERGLGYPFQIGYLKGTGGVFSGRIEEVPGGSAGNNSCIKLYQLCLE